jgi:two-component system CheB/CheR fusion protein
MMTAWEIALLASVAFVGILAIVNVHLYGRTVGRLERERRRLQAALHAANAGIWELSPDGRLFWDDNFYRLVGLEPGATPPSTDTFLAMIDPADRERMAEARRLMDRKQQPRSSDEYRLTRPDGAVVWLENHRTRVSDGGEYFIGITQDITRRKLAEERVKELLREADHRAKNQFMVILAIAREMRRTTASAAEFDVAFSARVEALARSHDLMARGAWRGTTLRDLIEAQLAPFNAEPRCTIEGPDVPVSASAAQYLGMAMHELATNALKHGALRSDAGRIRVSWATVGAGAPELSLAWAESGVPAAQPAESAGFGTKVLMQLTPAALSGRSDRRRTADGFVWTLAAPLSAVSPAAP